jgi:hypothetical protein
MRVRKGYFIKCIECGRYHLFCPGKGEPSRPPKRHLCLECKTRSKRNARKGQSVMEMAKSAFDIKIRKMNLTPIDDVPKPRRGSASELLVEYQLLKHGMVYKPEKGIPYIGDRILELDGSKAIVPVEVKKITRRGKRIIKIGKSFLERFTGVYVVLIQRNQKPSEYDFLIATSREMRHKVKNEKQGYLGKHDSTRKTPRWHVRIPISLRGWEGCLNEWSKVTGFSPESQEAGAA